MCAHLRASPTSFINALPGFAAEAQLGKSSACCIFMQSGVYSSREFSKSGCLRNADRPYLRPHPANDKK